MTPFEVAALALLLCVAVICLTVLLHQRAEYRQRTSMRLADGEAAKITAKLTEWNDATARVLAAHADRLRATENELTRLLNRNGR